MKVVVSYEFDSQEEAAAFLGGAEAKAPAKKKAAGKKASKAKKEEVQEEAPAEEAAPAVDVEAALAEVRSIVSGVLKKPNVPENKAHIVGLIQKHGGSDKATTIPDANLVGFLAELKAFASQLENQVAAEESLI